MLTKCEIIFNNNDQPENEPIQSNRFLTCFFLFRTEFRRQTNGLINILKTLPHHTI